MPSSHTAPTCPLCGNLPAEPRTLHGATACTTCTQTCSTCGFACLPGEIRCPACLGDEPVAAPDVERKAS